MEIPLLTKKNFGILLAMLCLVAIGLLGYHELRRFSGAYTFCQRDQRIYASFLNSDVCSSPELRHAYEHLDLIKCRKTEERLVSENAVDCAIKLWVVEGPIGFLAFEIISDIYQKLTGYITMVAICAVFVLGFVLHVSRRQTGNQKDVQMLAFMMGAAHSKFDYRYLEQAPTPQYGFGNTNKQSTVSRSVTRDVDVLD